MNIFRIDLHTHSYYSDGTASPEELVLLAKKKKLTAIALTDHDTVDGLPEMKKYCERHEIQYVPGIELSCWEQVDGKKVPIHIVGLFFQTENKELRISLEQMKEWRNRRNQELLQRMKEDGLLRSEEELFFGQRKGGLYKITFQNYLIRKGMAADRKECQDKFFEEGKRYYLEKKKITAREAIALIHQAQGLAILAHLNQYSLELRQIEQMLKQLKRYGLDGIETRYATYSSVENRIYQYLARKWDLLESGGSDFHGENKRGQELGTGFGNLSVPEEFLNKMKKYIRERRRT